MHLKHLLIPSLLASALLLSAGHALAGTDLSVTGKIERAGACSLTLGNGGTVDLGTLSRKDLRESSSTWFWDIPVPLTIACQTPTRVAFKVLNNREDSSHPGLSGNYGLGAPGGRMTGSYYPMFGKIVGDGKPLIRLTDLDGGGRSWEVGQYMIGPWYLISWAESGGTVPQAFRTISGSLEISVGIARTADLDLSQEIAIDGSATIELVYL